jgi:histidinol-phosphate aminotransferase
MVEMIERYHPKGIFICNPNNPTGQYLTRDELEAILDAGKNSLLTLDEAYISFVDDAWSSLNMIRSGNVIVLRTMTKDYALAGLRLGCAIAEPEVISILRRVRPPWNVNVVAQRAGVIALENDEYLERSKRSFHEAKSFLIGALSGIGLPPFPSQTNFLLVKVGDARRFRLALLRRGIAIRDCSSFGMPQYVRIAVGTLPNCQKLVTVIREIMGKSDDSRLQGKDNSLN